MSIAMDLHASRPKRSGDAERSGLRLARRLGLHHVAADELRIRRKRQGTGFSYLAPDGRVIHDQRVLWRLKSLAVPPAYEDVRYAEDPHAHLQAIGRDAAGRLQYRYHVEWEKVRELRKAGRLARLAEVLPKIRRSVAHHLASNQPKREVALAAVIELVARSGIRPGHESYARLRGTRGAVTLLKSNVVCAGSTITLKFRAKGGKRAQKELTAPTLAQVIRTLQELPGRRLFRYLNEAGEAHDISARDVNAFLREIAGVAISLKDFRTLLASVSVLDALAKATPAASKRQRRRQVLEAIRAAADTLDNTPAVCAKSYVHETVVTAFEEGALQQFAEHLRHSRSAPRRAEVLAQVVAAELD